MLVLPFALSLLPRLLFSFLSSLAAWFNIFLVASFYPSFCFSVSGCRAVFRAEAEVATGCWGGCAHVSEGLCMLQRVAAQQQNSACAAKSIHSHSSVIPERWVWTLGSIISPSMTPPEPPLSPCPSHCIQVIKSRSKCIFAPVSQPALFTLFSLSLSVFNEKHTDACGGDLQR